MGRVKDHSFWESAKYNNTSFMLYYYRLLEMTISAYEWKNLPETVDERFLEIGLFGDGHMVWFEEPDIGQIVCRAALGGTWSIYNIPTIRNAYASNGFYRQLDETDSVIIYNNMIRTNSIIPVEYYAKRLWDLDRTIDVNAKAQKTPILITCPETQRFTLLNLYKKYDGNEPVIFGDNNLDPNGIKSIQTGAPYVGDKLSALRQEIWNEALTYLGISSVDYEKKERLLVKELTQSEGATQSSRYSKLHSRQQACEEINRMFGTDIWCEFREPKYYYDQFGNPQISEPNTADSQIQEKEVLNNE